MCMSTWEFQRFFDSNLDQRPIKRIDYQLSFFHSFHPCCARDLSLIIHSFNNSGFYMVS